MQLLGLVNDTTSEEGSSNFINKKNSESIVEQAMKETSNQKNVEADSSCIANKNSTAKQPQQMERRPLPHFPQCFQKSKNLLDVLKQLHINISLVEALEQMPNYLKFMKDLLSNNRMSAEFGTIALTEGWTTMLRNKLPPKLKDPESFTVPCSIGNHYVGKALCDLSASINLMPISIFRKLGIGKARPSPVTIQLADRLYAHPEGKIEDVLVRVDKFIFPVDFIILECEANKEVPIILGRPFLAIARTLIDVQKGESTMRVNDQHITFNVFDAMKCADIDEKCHAVEIVDTIVQEEFA
ncbi:Retrovirus-related Pol polyprotein from transposon 17.6 [Gossypium australe]|uniref:Retrovirus-related Pol polyprotein from transposon 17.6 n=1 Tax=Gossypium australe TaxID=47621 RepID=A0A5B6VNR3_9ROSI|nr:Retrovirus-related Pol polyprotein from transposon 17.6 [Gossypium australe]